MAGSSFPQASSVPAASQAEMEAGTETAVRGMSPLRVAQAIAAQYPPIALITGVTHTLSAADIGVWNRCMHLSGCAITVPTGVFAAYGETYVEAAGLVAPNTVRFVSGAGMVINLGEYTLSTQYAVAGLKFSAQNVCTLFGNITAP